MGQHKVAKAIKEKHVIKFQKFDSPKSQKLTLIINGLRSLPRPYGMVLELSLHRISQVLSLSVFEKVPLYELLTKPDHSSASSDHSNQLTFNYF